MDDTTIGKRAPTERFSGRASDYVAGRPGYPPESIAAIFEGLGAPEAITVADLGAGTGISARLLGMHGAKVIALEPNAAMREHAEPAPNVTWSAATAEETGLATASIDLVTAFQAFHWFRPVTTLREIARIVRPGGRAAVVYNERDENDPFTAAYGAIVRRFATDNTEQRRLDARATFEAYPGWERLRVVEHPQLQALDRAGIHARTKSSSYLPREGAAAADLMTACDALFDRYATDGFANIALKTTVSVGELRTSRE